MKSVWLLIAAAVMHTVVIGQNVFTADIKVNGLTVGRGAGSIGSNSAFGTSALLSNTSGYSNVAVGFQALNYNTTGYYNTALGYNSMATLTTGIDNLAVGDWTMPYVTTGSFNTIVGSHVGVSFPASTSNTVAIGTYNSVSFYSPSSGNVILGGSTTDNGLARVQVNGAINQSSVKSAMLKADVNGTLVSAVAGVDYAAPGATSGWSLSGNTNGSSNFLGTTDASDLVFKTNGTERLRVISGGNVLIGKTSQSNVNYRLDVGGNVRANKLVVNSTGADFVFDSSYRLVPLDEVADYIRRNKHLPGIPSAGQMEKEGLDVGDNQTRLLQKIEELTLYLIGQQKKAEEQNAMVLQLKKENEELKQLLQRQSEDMLRRIEQLEKR